jgi:LCP family protein required for cell wall assembly
MADGEKPYRLYRGGRVKGKVPAPGKPARPARTPRGTDGDGAARRDLRLRDAPPRRSSRPPRIPRPRWFRWRWRYLAVGLLVFLVFAIIWGAIGYISFSGGVSDANKRLGRNARAALTHQGGLLFSTTTDVLLLGTDHARGHGRSADQHSDSIMLVRSDPSHHRIVYLSIPRDLRVDIPGHGPDKINAAMQIGGPALAVRTVRALTGLPVNHLVVVDFGEFRKLIDALGGVTINVPAPILSNRFDCPYASESRCQQWPGWKFAKGPQHMNGQRALIYSRIRENRLNPAESDITRGERQQAVMQAVTSKLASVSTLVRMPFIGGDLLKPLATDLSAAQFLQLGWRKFRAGQTYHCRLGGSPSSVGGQSVIIGTEENVATVHMVTGDSAPQPPLPGSGPFGPGCVVGSQRFK